jgi:hypothetical protein
MHFRKKPGFAVELDPWAAGPGRLAHWLKNA